MKTKNQKMKGEEIFFLVGHKNQQEPTTFAASTVKQKQAILK